MTGITHYTTTTKGIGGAIKKRIADFVVREITPEGRGLEIKCFTETDVKHIPLQVPLQGEGKENLHLTMEKFNLDTAEAVRRVSRALRVSPKRIGYAGLKDRRAITAQRISVWNPDTKLVENFRQRYVALREPEWKQEKIDIGALKGNFFEITIRAIEMGEKELREQTQKCLSEMEKGVANYFGEQRFGGIREVTHLVGREFIRGNMEAAVMTYLTHPSNEEKEIAIARKNLADTKDFSRALKEFPEKFRYERLILRHLSVFPRDFVGAFQNMPKHLAYLFTHAYQSYLFNMVINERIESGAGIGPIDGDVLDNGVPTGQLFGFDSEIAGGKLGEIEKKVLDAEGVKLSDFKIKGYGELSCSGARKKILVMPIEPKIIGIEADELNEGKLKMRVSFGLEKGNYATTILRELTKTPKAAETE